MNLQEIETLLFFNTPLEQGYGCWIKFWQWMSNGNMYMSYIVLPDYKWGILTENTTFTLIKKENNK